MEARRSGQVQDGKKRVTHSLPFLFTALKMMAKRRASGLVSFVAAFAYHFSLALPVAFTQPGPTF